MKKAIFQRKDKEYRNTEEKSTLTKTGSEIL